MCDAELALIHGHATMLRHARLIACLTAVTMCAVLFERRPGAKEPTLDEVLDRVTTFVTAYGPRLAAIVGEEYYTQWVDTEPGAVVVPEIRVTRRVIRSDFVLTQEGDRQTWVAFRDAFEVDGVPVRDREERLVALLSAGGEPGWRRSAALANESARFNLGSRVVTRNINIPTFALQLLDRRNRERFKFSRQKPKRDNARSAASDAVDESWEIEYRERDRPTLVRQASGRDQPLRGTISVDPETGEVWRTHLTWERGPGGYVDVIFGRVPDIDDVVPVRMEEAYRSGPTTIRGEATYSNFRRFQTSVRVVTP